MVNTSPARPKKQLTSAIDISFRAAFGRSSKRCQPESEDQGRERVSEIARQSITVDFGR